MSQITGVATDLLELLQLLQKLFAASARTVSASAEAVATSARAVTAVQKLLPLLLPFFVFLAKFLLLEKLYV